MPGLHARKAARQEKITDNFDAIFREVFLPMALKA
jgi:hypothetical protein